MPPKTPSEKTIHKKVEILKGFITAANLTDNQAAMVRMSSIAASKIVLDLGIEPIMQITCRDRNRLAMQADVLGAAALGIKNILCVSGDHQKFGNHPSAKNVYDIDSMQLINMLKRMRDDAVFQNEEPIRNREKGKVVPPEIFIGAAANPFGHPKIYRPFRLMQKIEAGADFIQTQPVFDLELFEEWLFNVRELELDKRTAILAGLTPVRTASALYFMKQNVPGIHIPDQIITRMEKADNPENEGYELAKETLLALRKMKGIHGVHFMAIGWEAIIPKLLNDLSDKPNTHVKDVG